MIAFVSFLAGFYLLAGLIFFKIHIDGPRSTRYVFLASYFFCLFAVFLFWLIYLYRNDSTWPLHVTYTILFCSDSLLYLFLSTRSRHRKVVRGLSLAFLAVLIVLRIMNIFTDQLNLPSPLFHTGVAFRFSSYTELNLDYLLYYVFSMIVGVIVLFDYDRSDQVWEMRSIYRPIAVVQLLGLAVGLIQFGFSILGIRAIIVILFVLVELRIVASHLRIVSLVESTREMKNDLAIQRTMNIQTAKLASLGTFLAGIAHEVNNPNNFISINAQNLQQVLRSSRVESDSLILPEQVLSNGNPRDWLVSIVNDIKSGSERISTLVHRLREFSALDQNIHYQDVNLNESVHNALVIIDHRIREVTDRFNLDIQNEPIIIKGIDQEIQQIVINLVVNALEEHRSSGDSILLETRIGESGNPGILRVTNFGAGIDKSIVGEIFQPFFTMKRQIGGTGLGLSIVKMIVENLNADIRVMTDEQTYTTFEIAFPGWGEDDEKP